MNIPLFKRLYIPTGFVTEGAFYFSEEFLDQRRNEQLELVNMWNRIDPGVWQYWIE